MNNEDLKLIYGMDCKEQFKKAYQNRYTWEANFLGYQGSCSFNDVNGNEIKGTFSISKDLEVIVYGVQDNLINKSIKSQLWEVGIHRIRRPFEEVHGENTFKVGDFNEVGMEVIVGGKNKGDKYRIKNNVVTMVYRNIHGSLINIFTEEITNTGDGYLSKRYSSQYLDPSTRLPLRDKNLFIDEFKPLNQKGPWVLTKRVIENKGNNINSLDKKTFKFFNLKSL